MSGKRRLGIGLIGTGFMGKAHALGFTIAARVFDLPFELDLVSVADVTQEGAEAARGRLGFRKATADWRELLTDPEIDIIDITTPNLLHKEMALAAFAHGKHVYCEKPLAPTVADCAEMVAAAEKAGVVTQVGFNYLKNPLIFSRATLSKAARSAKYGRFAAFTRKISWRMRAFRGVGGWTRAAAAVRSPTSAAT